MNENAIEVTSLSFRAGFIQDGKYSAPKSEFKVGPGPCGKTVTNLAHIIAEGCLMVFQACDDGEVKVFTYPLTQLTGRIEAVIKA